MYSCFFSWSTHLGRSEGGPTGIVLEGFARYFNWNHLLDLRLELAATVIL